ncbi:MAG: VWA domain-containing protein [Pirellulales bacterium]|nr:VWA domain-containing protein [Pirellulales bacterium]
MFKYSIVFDNTAWLWLFALLPIIGWLGRRSLSGLGKWRRGLAIGFRSLVMALFILALAGMQTRKTIDRMTVIYILDQSLSIPEPQRLAMIDYVNGSVAEHRKDESQDRAGVIVFGRDAVVEFPPVDFDLQLAPHIESLLDPEFTDLASAMRRASALFTGDTAKRIVIVSDGNENLGDALRQARAMTALGISIDGVAVPLVARDEISIDKLAIPPDVRKDQPFELRVVLNRETTGKTARRNVRGKLQITRRAAGHEEILVEQPVELPPGKKPFTVREVINQADFYTYEARFVPDYPADDGTLRNNTETAFTYVRGRGQVLFIVDHAEPGEFDFLIQRLKTEGIQVTVQLSNQTFSSLPELQRFDAVILANVPRASGNSAESVASFSDEQIEILVNNTRLGCGLFVIGGPNSFGAGGWSGTKLEEALPVEFQIKNAKVAPVGALALMMHAGEMPQANYWQKRISLEAIKALGYTDWCGMVQWSGREDWLWNARRSGMLPVGPNRKMMMARVDRMNIGDMPNFDAPMQMAANAFQMLDKDPDAKPAVKHMVIISDGDPNAPSAGTIRDLNRLKVTVTTVCVPSHGSADAGYQQVMKRIADQTGGKFYNVQSGRALPRIYQTEVRRVSRPLIKNISEPGLPPTLINLHEMMKGIDTDLPPITGFVMTTIKESPLVEVIMRSPAVKEERNATILAGWTYGLGKSVAWTTDAGARWARDWTNWEGYDRFFSQIVRWTMRPMGDTEKYTIATDVQGKKTRVIITALDEGDEYLNYQTMAGTAIGPDMKKHELRVEQVAPGRYVGEFDSEAAGSYSIAVTPGAGKGMLLTGVHIGYSSEYRDRETNRPLLEAIVELPAEGGKPGQLVEGALDRRDMKKMLAVDPFRRDLPKAKSIEDIWHWLVMCGSCLFLADVFIRRVQVSLDWIPPFFARARDWMMRRQAPVRQEEIISRLKRRKAEVDTTIDDRRAASRFDIPSGEAESGIQTSILEQATRSTAPPAGLGRPPEQTLNTEPEEESYTERLLKAKKDVWKDRGKGSKS